MIGIHIGVACQAGQSFGGAAATNIAEADFANASYTLNGAAVTFADLFTDAPLDASVNTTFQRLAGVGLRVEKVAGVAPIGATTGNWAEIECTPALFAALNVAGGFTAVADIVSDNFVDGAVSKGNTTFGLIYRDDSFAHVGKYVYATDSVNDEGGASMVLYNYDYDLGTGASDQDFDGAWHGGGQFVGTMADIVRGYFGADIATISQPAATVAFPHPEATKIRVTGRANPHHGDASQKLPVSSRLTVSRIRFYTPAQPAGWVPGD